MTRGSLKPPSKADMAVYDAISQNYKDSVKPREAMSDTVNLIGVKADGSSDFLGTAPMPPSMKRADIAREQFGELAGDDMPSNTDFCLYALEMYHEWLVAQGWRQVGG